jgi:hypothetical protein
MLPSTALKSLKFSLAAHVRVALATICLLLVAGCDNGAAERTAREIEQAQSQVQRIAADLDKRTTETGVYIRVKEGDIKEDDPWGTRIAVSYAQGGVAEFVIVRSAGPDREFHTDDDVAAQGMAANLKGIGEGIKNNVEETASNTAKGIVKGTVKGVKESIKESLPFQKKKADKVEAQPDESK